MMASRPPCPFSCPSQRELDAFLGAGVSVQALIRPEPMRIAHGDKAHDGRFEPDTSGARWFAFEEGEDIVFWHWKTGAIAARSGRAFALGEEIVDRAATCAFDCALNLFASPLEWLQAERDGIVVLDWRRAFDRLRDSPRIAVAEEILPLYRRHMKPARMPELFVIPSMRSAA